MDDTLETASSIFFFQFPFLFYPEQTSLAVLKLKREEEKDNIWNHLIIDEKKKKTFTIKYLQALIIKYYFSLLQLLFYLLIFS